MVKSQLPVLQFSSDDILQTSVAALHPAPVLYSIKYLATELCVLRVFSSLGGVETSKKCW